MVSRLKMIFRSQISSLYFIVFREIPENRRMMGLLQTVKVRGEEKEIVLHDTLLLHFKQFYLHQSHSYLLMVEFSSRTKYVPHKITQFSYFETLTLKSIINPSIKIPSFNFQDRLFCDIFYVMRSREDVFFFLRRDQ